MPVFSYTARDQRGVVTQGTVDAESNQGAVAQLREQGLWVTDLRVGGARARPGEAAPVPQTDASLGRRLFSPVSPAVLALFYRQLHALLNSGVGMYSALEILSQPNGVPNAALRKVVLALAQQALRGRPLSEEMPRYPWLFQRLQVRMVQAGEQGGFLPDVLRRLADYLEREHAIRQDVRRKTLYPKLVLVVFLLVLPIRMPLTLAGYLGGLSQILLWVACAGIPLWFLGRLFLTSVAGANFADQVKLALPVVGGVIRKLAVARFARSLAALYGSGVILGSALTLSAESCGNHVLEQAVLRIVPAVEKGAGLTQSLEATRFFPAMFTGMVHTGETSGNLDTMLDKASEFYEQEATHATTQLTVIMGVAVLIGVAILVAMKVIGFYTGMLGGIMGSAGA
ncbi:MAG: type II secretion system F family protein [Armatimonadetes bacterium]|nr:type II secretion system F family protein [Armatimonadota bacterium]